MRAYYDLLASEARLASYIVIAQGNFGQEHWFALGRLLTSAGSAPALLSWSGSMFEYLMPLLVMPNYENTLLDRTYQAVVRRQIEYGRQRGVPWGISESGYNTIDLHKTYQYRAFGVPGLGLKRGLAEDLVIAPYASALGADGCAGGRLPKSGTTDGRGPARRLRTLRSHRLHAFAIAAWRQQRHGAAVHGASRRDEPAVAGVCVARQADATPLSGRSHAASGRFAAARTRSQGDRTGLSACQ